jgi:hypothetical protein
LPSAELVPSTVLDVIVMVCPVVVGGPAAVAAGTTNATVATVAAPSIMMRTRIVIGERSFLSNLLPADAARS